MSQYLYAPPKFGIDMPGNGQPHALVTVADESVVWVDTDRGIWFEVPVGFTFDGASVPKPLWSTLDADWIDLLIPGLGHDYCYRSDAQVIDVPTASLRQIDRDEADEVIRDIADHIGVSKADQNKVFFAVRVAGWASFRAKTVAWTP
jgi:hypothetical protein